MEPLPVSLCRLDKRNLFTASSPHPRPGCHLLWDSIQFHSLGASDCGFSSPLGEYQIFSLYPFSLSYRPGPRTSRQSNGILRQPLRFEKVWMTQRTGGWSVSWFCACCLIQIQVWVRTCTPGQCPCTCAARTGKCEARSRSSSRGGY